MGDTDSSFPVPVLWCRSNTGKRETQSSRSCLAARQQMHTQQMPSQAYLVLTSPMRDRLMGCVRAVLALCTRREGAAVDSCWLSVCIPAALPACAYLLAGWLAGFSLSAESAPQGYLLCSARTEKVHIAPHCWPGPKTPSPAQTPEWKHSQTAVHQTMLLRLDCVSAADCSPTRSRADSSPNSSTVPATQGPRPQRRPSKPARVAAHASWDAHSPELRLELRRLPLRLRSSLAMLRTACPRCLGPSRNRPLLHKGA